MNGNGKKDDLDAFWDLSSLIPKSRPMSQHSKSTDTVEISSSSKQKAESASESSTVIKRYVDPMHYENKRIRKEAFEGREEYIPDSALLHKVTLKKRKSAYELYTDFLSAALNYSAAEGEEAPYVSFYSYVPQYDQLSPQQLAYYLWWKKCFKEGQLIKTDLSYLLLYVYELINIGDAQDVKEAQMLLSELWNIYHKEFPAISGKLAVWICDFSLLHRLPPPANISGSVTKYVNSLKEFFIHIPDGDCDACVRSLLKYGTEYDYHTSKFATERNIDIFDRHIFGAVLTAVRFFSKDGKLLSSLSSEDSKLIRNAFEGALCVSKWRYEIEVKYCSFSRTNELRFIMGDIVKYSENKIRGFLGIKSKLSVYSIGTDLQKALDAYFDEALSREAPRIKKKEEKAEYDVLYDLPQSPLSLENAKKIENASWDTTQDLISAFEEEENEPEPATAKPQAPESERSNGGELSAALGEYYEFALAVKSGDERKISEISQKKGMLPEAIVDIINEIAVDIIGDIVIEDNGNCFEIIECYLNVI